MPTSPKSSLHLALLAGAFGVALAASSASAQEYAGPESVQVNGQRFHAEGGRVNSPLEKISLSGVVRYDDLDLRTSAGAGELKWRIRDAARDICAHLAVAYPVYEAPLTSCYKTAIEDAAVRANAAIRDAREYGIYND
jgi:UrcA family protein